MNKKWSLTVFGVAALALSVAASGFSIFRGAKAEEVNAAGETIVLDGTTLRLTDTATTAESNIDFGGVTYVASVGVKYQSSKYASNSFGSQQSILIPKNGFLYNSTAFSTAISKFEVYSNYGASTSVSVGVAFGSEPLSATTDFVWTKTLSTANSVYEIPASSIPSNATYFRYQVTNAKNSQVQFRITLSSGETPIEVSDVTLSGETEIDSAGAESVMAEYSYGVNYSSGEGTSQVDVEVTPSAIVSEAADGKFTVTYSANGDYTVKVTSREDDKKSATLTTTVTGFETKQYKKVTEITAGEYLITNGSSNSLKNEIVKNRAANGTAPTANDDGTLWNTTSATVWTIGKVGDYWTIQDPDGLYLSGTGANSQAALAETLTEYGKWTISFNSEGAAIVTNLGNTIKDVNATLRNNSSYGWATYAASTGDAPVFYIDVTSPSIGVDLTGSGNLGVGDTATLTINRINDATGTANWSVTGDAVSLNATTGDEVIVIGVKDGTATVTASVDGFPSVSVDFTVTKQLTSLVIVTPATKLEYYADESFDPTGVVLKAIYDDESEKTLSDGEYTYSKSGALTTSDTTITFSYTEGGITKIVDQAITVSEKVMTSFEIKSLPTKTSYCDGQEFSSDGLTLTLHYSGDSTLDVTTGFTLDVEDGYVFTKEDALAGTKEITVTYREMTQTFSVDVHVATGLVEKGRYYVLNEDKTAGLSAVSSSSKSPTQVDMTVANELLPFDFALTEDNYYSISAKEDDTTVYLTVKADSNSGLRVQTSLTSAPWLLESNGSDGYFLSSAYGVDGSGNIRYLTSYSSSSTLDWRCYPKKYVGDDTKNGQNSNISLAKEGSFAESVAKAILDNVACDASGVTAPSTAEWEAVKAEFEKLTIANEINLLKNGVADAMSDSAIEQALAKYDFIVNKYTSVYDDFLARANNSSAVSAPLLMNSSSSIWAVAAIASVGVIAGTSLIVLRKKKEN